MIEKINGERNQIDFLRNFVRPFYTDKIIVWQYSLMENVNETTLYFLFEQEEIISSQGMIPTKMVFKSEKILSAKSESSFLKENFRGRRLFEKIYFYTIEQAEKDNVELIWGFTALSSVWRKKLHFDVYDGIISETEFLISWRTAYNLTKVLKNKGLKFRAKQVLKLAYSLIKSKKFGNNKAIELLEATSFDEVVSIYNEWLYLNTHMIALDLSEKYLNWRISENPKCKYETYIFNYDSKSLGFAILNITTEKCYIVELICLDESLISEFIKTLIIHLKSNGSISHLVYWGSNLNHYNNTIHKTIRELGGIQRINSEMNFVVKRTFKFSRESYRIEDFYLTGLWTEGFTI